MILVLIPNKRNLDAEVMYRSVGCEQQLLDACGKNIRVIRDFAGPGDAGLDPERDRVGLGTCSPEVLQKRVAHTAPLRQRLIDTMLEPDDSHVLWIDADIVAYPATILAQLLTISHNDIVAPSVFLETDPEWFYDTAGFVEDGKWCSWRPPHFKQTTDVVDLDGVGCFYLVPAEVYRRGARHEPVDGFTDHLAVCRFARSQGYRVKCATKIRVLHADFRLYGRSHHNGT